MDTSAAFTRPYKLKPGNSCKECREAIGKSFVG